MDGRFADGSFGWKADTRLMGSFGWKADIGRVSLRATQLLQFSDSCN